MIIAFPSPQSSCSPETVRAYDHLSHMIGSAIVHEEEKYVWPAARPVMANYYLK